MRIRNENHACVGQSNRNAKLKDTEVVAIRADHETGMTQTELAVKYGISQTNICNIIAGKTWRHLL
jgi:hypothetical protein